MPGQEGAQARHLPLFHKQRGGALAPAPAVRQLNVGKLCNQVGKHCHVDAGPDGQQISTRDTRQRCLDALARTDIARVDLTGGAPEMNPIVFNRLFAI